jgi:heme a synthase
MVGKVGTSLVRRLVGPVTPRGYRTTVFVAIVSLVGIVLTGAAVRLSRAGLGCENWPTCTGDRVVPAWELRPWVEFGNRLITGAVSAAVAAAVLAAYRRHPRRTDLVWWAWGLVAGVVGQIALGGVSVLVDLNPLFVAAHFLLSMVLLWNVLVLWVRAGSGPGPGRALVSRSILIHGRALVVGATLVLVTGTLVTGTGPHGGDSRAARLSLQLVVIARIHSATVWVFLAATVAFALRLARLRRGPLPLVRALLVAIVAQGALGYVQYALGVPAVLVEGHILGAVVVWSLTVVLYLRLTERPVIDDDSSLGYPVDELALGQPFGENNAPETVNEGPTLDRMKV